MNQFRTPRMLLALGTAVLLAACGTGGPSAVSTQGPPPPSGVPDQATAGPTRVIEPSSTPEVTVTVEMVATEVIRTRATATDTVTATGTVTATDALTGTDALTSTQALTRTNALTATEMTTPTAMMTDSASAGFIGIYTASLPGPDTGRPVTLTLGADGEATLFTDQRNGDAIAVETGTWFSEVADTAVVSLTGNTATTDRQPNVITFTLTGDQLVGVGFSQPELYGTVGLALQKVADTGTGQVADPGANQGTLSTTLPITDTTISFPGVYTSSLVGPGAGRPVILTLGDDGVAVLTTNNADGITPTVESGSWTAEGSLTATVSLITNTVDASLSAAPNIITFTISGDRLIGVGFSQPELYGTVGLVLQKVVSDTTPPAQ